MPKGQTTVSGLVLGSGRIVEMADSFAFKSVDAPADDTRIANLDLGSGRIAEAKAGGSDLLNVRPEADALIVYDDLSKGVTDSDWLDFA
ncbi:MAG: hypothetical protein ACFBSD_13590 [Paracoccaceae bacterium]